MEYILYYNDTQKGYGFYETNVLLHPNDRDELQKICNDVADPVTEAVALRYAPFQNDRYLLSVIFRQPNGVGNLLRGTNTIVHFLMNEEEADRFFADITQDDLYNPVCQAVNLLERTNARLSMPECPLSKQSNSIQDFYLLTAASYADAPVFSKQAYFGIQAPAWQEVVAMLKFLPKPLRKRISFHTDIQSIQESKGVAVNFCTPETLEKAWRNGMTGGLNSTDKFLYVVDRNGNCQSIKEDNKGLDKGRKLLDVLNALPCRELTYPHLVENASRWEDMEKLLQLIPQEQSMDAIVRLIPEHVLLQEVKRNRLKESTMVWLCQSEELPEEVFSAIVNSEKVSAASLSQLCLSDCFSEEQILKVIASGKLEEKDLDTMVDFAENNHKKQAAKALRKTFRDISAANRQGKYQEEIPQRPRLQRKEHRKPHTKKSATLTVALKNLGKIAVLAAMLLGCVVLIKSLLLFNVLTNAQGYITLMISANVVGIVWKILGLILLTAAISSFITYHIMKWKSKKQHKNKEHASQ